MDQRGLSGQARGRAGRPAVPRGLTHAWALTPTAMPERALVLLGPAPMRVEEGRHAGAQGAPCPRSHQPGPAIEAATAGTAERNAHTHTQASIALLRGRAYAVL